MSTLIYARDIKLADLVTIGRLGWRGHITSVSVVGDRVSGSFQPVRVAARADTEAAPVERFVAAATDLFTWVGSASDRADAQDVADRASGWR